ncbi:hypothetical protein GJU40_16450 [Bacillus lacus]|uniref:Uncharacterized protein n=1 Tax=Metabacillus lacus TaxID=1983721 RepID=A0A7X2M059_9BACI|nr:hypothetical protein [Metabacillus lacus]MRX73733.1 hypothetical protein [Metabacillus lacus]
MKNSTPCPNCQEEITIEDFAKQDNHFKLACPYCEAKIKETALTYIILPAMVISALVFFSATIWIKESFEALQNVPTMLVFVGFLLPFYFLYQKYYAAFIVNKGSFKVK